MITTKDFCKMVAEKSGFTQKDVRAIMDAMADTLYENVALKEEDVKVFNGLTVSTALKDAHTARNPLTGESVNVPAKYKISAKFSPSVKTRIN